MEALPSSSLPATTFTPSPLKPKRRFLYKDDLPGFSIDSDLEAEKMPISKRRPKEEPKVEKIIPKVPEEEEDSEEEGEPKKKNRGPSPSKSRKKEADPSKPKRIIIYKDDLPGFEVLPDSDVEEAERKKKKGAKLAKAKAVKEEVQEVEKPKKTEAPVNAADDAPKPKRIIIYKDDLPGFEALPDSDVDEKLPGKKRGGKPGPKSGKRKKQAISAKIIEDEDKDSDSVSVDSFSSTSSGPKKKRKMNRTGFPSPKKKKVSIKNQEINNLSPKVKLDKNLVMNNLKSHSGSSDFPSKSSKSEDGVSKKKVPKQLKLDRFITKQQKPKSSHSENGSDDETANSRRSAAMKAKNYR